MRVFSAIDRFKRSFFPTAHGILLIRNGGLWEKPHGSLSQADAPPLYLFKNGEEPLYRGLSCSALPSLEEVKHRIARDNDSSSTFQSAPFDGALDDLQEIIRRDRFEQATPGADLPSLRDDGRIRPTGNEDDRRV